MKAVPVKIIVFIAAIVLFGAIVSLALPPTGYNNGYAPTQPIPYDHSLHAGQYQIPCLYCHSNAERSRHATVPALNVCMNCHMTVKPDSPYIQKIRDAYNEGKSIPWVRVHMLPDFVHFNHKRHVAKGVACQTCHGPIQTMKEVKQFSDLSMGWCVNCHRKPENKAPLNCTTCHH